MRIITTIVGEGYSCEIKLLDDGSIYFQADADIDADGANGQNGRKAAYMTGNRGSEYLANGGMAEVGGRVVAVHDWAKSVVLCDMHGNPKIFNDGVIASRTSYHYPGVSLDNPAAYVDAETVPYIAVPPAIVNAGRGKILGCKARVEFGDKSIDCVVADVGPRKRVGELSIAAARELGINPDPRHGGRETPDVHYWVWPGIAANNFELIG